MSYVNPLSLMLNIDDIDPGWYHDWSWLIGELEDNQLLAMSCFGDLLFKKADNETVLYLDTLDGSVDKFADNLFDYDQKMSSPSITAYYFSKDLVEILIAKNQTLSRGEMYMYQIAPILGGSFESDNVVKMSGRVVLALTGQLHRQLQTNLKGKQITGFELRAEGIQYPETPTKP